MRTEAGMKRESAPSRTMRCMECKEQFRFDSEQMYVGKTTISLVCIDCGQRHSILITEGGK